MRYVLVSGGVMSGIGKGIIASSTGVLLQAQGARVTAIKIDPYLNVDAGLMSPHEHGEVYVLHDGSEVDLDLGNYERFLDVRLTRQHSITTGQIYKSVIERERRGDYLGKTVQVVPHITDEIQRRIESAAAIPVQGELAPELCIIELGGTVGDIESMPFVEALRQLRYRHKAAFVHIHLSYIAELHGEQKSKPTQQSIKELCSLGLLPDLVVCRSARTLDAAVRDKVALFGQIDAAHVLSVPDVHSIYEVPRILNACGLLRLLARHFAVPMGSAELDAEGRISLAHWPALERDAPCIRVALIGKYTQPDAYLSVAKAVEHAAMQLRVSTQLVEIDLDHLTSETAAHVLGPYDAVIVPGGFGERGFQAKLCAAQYARVHGVPFLGICLGFQIAVIELARNVLGIADATSEEFDTGGTHVIKYMPDFYSAELGGTMRLGVRATHFTQSSSCLREAYGRDVIHERHRHRYEVEPRLLGGLEATACFVATDEHGERMEVLELHNHPFYVGTQFHPEFSSRPASPSPVFLALLTAAIK